MRAKLPYLIIVGLGIVVLGVRALMGLPLTASNPTPTSSQGPTLSQTSQPSPTATTQPSNPPDKGPSPTALGGSGFTLEDFSPTISGEQAQTWATGLANSAKFLRLGILGDQVGTVTGLESGTKPYADVVAALQDAQSNNIKPTMSADIVVTTAALTDLSDTDKAFIARWGQTPQAQGWLIHYQQQVTVTYGSNKQLAINATWAEGGYLKNDPNLGPIWVDTFRMDCSGLGAGLAICQG